jgi:hypothetical protein
MGRIEILGKPELRVFTPFYQLVISNQEAVLIQIVPLYC